MHDARRFRGWTALADFHLIVGAVAHLPIRLQLKLIF